MTEPFDTGDPNGRFLLTVLAGVADLERETVLERMWYGANRAAREGKGLDMSEAGVVRLIYRLVADRGYSSAKVADYLNHLGVPTSYAKDGRQVRRGKRKVNTSGLWRDSRVRYVLVNTTYMDVHRYGKHTKKNRDVITREVPAIVSPETWDKARRILRGNQIEATRNARRSCLLRSLIKCGVCGLTYTGAAYPGANRRPKAYYVCATLLCYRRRALNQAPARRVNWGAAAWMSRRQFK